MVFLAWAMLAQTYTSSCRLHDTDALKHQLPEGALSLTHDHDTKVITRAF